MSDIVLFALTALVILVFFFILDCFFKTKAQLPPECCGWKKTGKKGPFDIYSKRSWISNKVCKLYVWREEE